MGAILALLVLVVFGLIEIILEILEHRDRRRENRRFIGELKKIQQNNPQLFAEM